MQRVAVFASGSGSNYQAIMEYLANQSHPNFEVALLISDQPKAQVLERAKTWETKSYAVSVKAFPSMSQFEEAILHQLWEADIDFLVLAGYMRLLGPTLLNAFRDKIVNIHPSLLPSFPGKDAIRQALDYGVQVTGVTIHFVDEGMDTGPIIYQRPVLIDSSETADSLSTKIHTIEHEMYPQIIAACIRNLEGHE